ncbi:transposase [Dactylosporangium sp. NPDC050588]|uniref:IS110 family transposase n=1 Tax=Dactylosporangium sp. NPDC050588 TaxID=3157211 RepID=UPI00340B215B
MSTMARPQVEVTGGVDTHQDTHTAAALDSAGRTLATAQFPATTAGYAALPAWLTGFGRLVLVGVEGTGVYGAGLARYLRRRGIDLVGRGRTHRPGPEPGLPSPCP